MDEAADDATDMVEDEIANNVGLVFLLVLDYNIYCLSYASDAKLIRLYLTMKLILK